MPKTDNMMRNFKSLEDKRIEREKQRSPLKTLEFRIGFAVFILLFSAIDSGGAGLWIAAFLAAAVLVVILVRRKLKQNEANPNKEPVFNAKQKKSAGNLEYTEYSSVTESIRDNANSQERIHYSKGGDPWDIKDPKPPWEL